MAKQVTKRDMYVFIANTVEASEDISDEAKKAIKAFCQKEFAALSKKKKYVTKAQLANKELADKVEAYLVETETGAASVAEIADKFEVSTQKATAICRLLLDEKRVVRVTGEDKKVAYKLS